MDSEMQGRLDKQHTKEHLAAQQTACVLVGQAYLKYPTRVDMIDHVIGKDLDPALAFSVLELGPDLCQLMGNENAKKIGRQSIAFAIPTLWAIQDEGTKQFQHHLEETAKKGVGNFCTGVGLGVIAEAHPVGIAAVGVGGLGVLGYREFGPPSADRNKRLGQIYKEVDAGGDFESLKANAIRVKTLLGSTPFELTYGLATSGPGIMPGTGLAKEIEQAVKPQLTEQTLKSIGATLKNLPSLIHQQLAVPIGPRLAYEGVPANGIRVNYATSKGPEFLKMSRLDEIPRRLGIKVKSTSPQVAHSEIAPNAQGQIGAGKMKLTGGVSAEQNLGDRLQGLLGKLVNPESLSHWMPGTERNLVKQYRAVLREFGPDSFRTVEALTKLAACHRTKGRMEMAKGCLDLADEISEDCMHQLEAGDVSVIGQAPRPDNPLLSLKDSLVRFVADQYKHRGDASGANYEQRNYYYEIAANLYMKTLREGQPITVAQRHNMISVFHEVACDNGISNPLGKNLSRAYMMLEQEAKLEPMQSSGDYSKFPFVDFCRALNCENLGFFEEAEALQRKVLDWQIRNECADFSRAVDMMSGLIRSLVKQDRLSEAKQLGQCLVKLPTGVNKFSSRNVTPQEFYSVMSQVHDQIRKPVVNESAAQESIKESPGSLSLSVPELELSSK
jgi:hypothetical protein